VKKKQGMSLRDFPSSCYGLPIWPIVFPINLFSNALGPKQKYSNPQGRQNQYRKDSPLFIWPMIYYKVPIISIQGDHKTLLDFK